MTDESDKIAEEKRIRSALKNCNYPDWVKDKVKHQIEGKAQCTVKTKPMSKKHMDQKSRGMVVLSNGISERLQRIFKKHKINTAMKPHKTLRQTLVHPKDKGDTLKTGNCIYKICCKNCDLS